MKAEKFFSYVYNIINKYNAQEKIPRDYGLESPIYQAELHMIETIGDRQGITATELTKALSITKGAVSQTIAKLDARGLIMRKRVPGSSNTAQIFLTEKGNMVFNRHRQFHADLLQKIDSILSETSVETQEALEKICNVIENKLDNYQEEKNE